MKLNAQFTGRFGKPRPAEVLFERICRRNGIRQLLTKPYSPTTTGKVERWHQTLQVEFLNDTGPFASIEEAQAAVDEWREEYKRQRPHPSLAPPAPPAKFNPPADAGARPPPSAPPHPPPLPPPPPPPH